MSLQENLLTFVGKFQPENLAQLYPLNYCIPVYHTVSNERLSHLHHIIQYKNEQEFERDLDEMSKYFEFITWDEFKDFRDGNFKPKRKIALLTFDDGLSEFYDAVAPILERKGIYAINFINPKFIDNQELMYRCKASLLIDFLINSTNSSADLIKKIQSVGFKNQKELDEIASQLNIDFTEFLKIKKPYLTLNQLDNLTKRGFGISNHGFDHPLYRNLNLLEQLENTGKSAEYLEKHNFISESFAFPFTDFGVEEKFFTEIFKKKNLFCSFGSAGLKLDSFEKNLQRIPMESRKSASQILKEEVAYFRLKKILNKNTIHRK